MHQSALVDFSRVTLTANGYHSFDYSYALIDLTVYGRQESSEDSPPGWPQQCSITRTNGGGPDWPPVASVAGLADRSQWPRLTNGRSDDLENTPAHLLKPPPLPAVPQGRH